MSTLTAQPQAIPQKPTLLRVRRGLFEPYDISVAFAIFVGAILSAYGGENLLKFRDWMFPHIIRFSILGGIGLMLLAVIRLIAYRVREGKLTGATWREMLARHFGPRTLLSVFRFVVALEVMLLIYTTIKQRFARLNPGLHDELLIQIEKFVHLGFNPAWDIAAIGWPSWCLVFLDWTYWVWFPLKFLMLTYALTLLNRAKRDRFLASYLGLWIVGVLLGLALPSVGPFYIDETTLFPPRAMWIAGQLQVLLHVHYLVDLVPGQSGILVYGYGLMAMPSLHVTVAVLYALFGWGEGRFLRWFTIIYALLVFLGSLVTGWHYAIDGYAGVAIAAALWFGIGWVQKRRLKNDARPVTTCPFNSVSVD